MLRFIIAIVCIDAFAIGLCINGCSMRDVDVQDVCCGPR